MRRGEAGIDLPRHFHVVVTKELRDLVHTMAFFSKPYGGAVAKNVRRDPMTNRVTAALSAV
jgi:hypothetical protein